MSSVMFSSPNNIKSNIDGLNCVFEANVFDTQTKFTLAYDGVTNCKAGAIVNAANNSCLGGGGIDGRINQLGGPSLHKAREELPILDGSNRNRCFTGDAKITIAGNLPCEYVIHAVGPRFKSTGPFDEDLLLLGDAYKNAMLRGKEKQLTKIAFCILSAGIFRGGCSLEEIIKVGIENICKSVYPELERIYFCAFTETEQKLAKKVVEEFV